MNTRNKKTPLLITLVTASGILILKLALSYFATGWWKTLATRWKITFEILPLSILFISATWYLLLHSQSGPGQTDPPWQRSQAKHDLQKSRQRMGALFSLNQLSLHADHEKEMIDHALRVAVELTDAEGASYVPLDKHAYPLNATTHGKQPTTDLKAWVEYLASPAVHRRCQSCQRKEAVDNCPLIRSPFEQDLRVYCFPLGLGPHELGMINVYLKAAEPLNGETQQFVQMMADYLTLSLESVRLKQRERRSLQRDSKLDSEDQLRHLLQEELEHVQTLFDTDFASLTVLKPQEEEGGDHWAAGTLPENIQHEIRILTQRVLKSGEPLLLANGNQGNGKKPSTHHSIMAAPFSSREDEISGVLLVGRRGETPFQPQQLSILEKIVQQFALVVHNTNLIHELQYQTMLQERTRLAREIHDGLAQTLGYLKLQIAQIKRAVEQGELGKLPPMIQQSHQAVAEAYEDAREAIDGLQVDPTEKSFSNWLKQTISIFEENSSVERTTLEMAHSTDLPPEVQIQLIRIIQESLSNIRKHAQATEVKVTSWDDPPGVILEVRDNGRGFLPQEEDHYLQHGLRGMRERARLINAAFQIISQPGEGTTVRLRWRPGTREENHE